MSIIEREPHLGRAPATDGELIACNKPVWHLNGWNRVSAALQVRATGDNPDRIVGQ
ncbi:hypothetical protein V1290_005405 [Bradyrhizobium sp. AZCC 1578]|uniref:hypothetical protein n=1 Tax=Bradyrhizobium sp. AZCC 1578 TaxID=3117027 RepID=UPI002FF38B9E